MYTGYICLMRPKTWRRCDLPTLPLLLKIWGVPFETCCPARNLTLLHKRFSRTARGTGGGGKREGSDTQHRYSTELTPGHAVWVDPDSVSTQEMTICINKTPRRRRRKRTPGGGALCCLHQEPPPEVLLHPSTYRVGIDMSVCVCSRACVCDLSRRLLSCLFVTIMLRSLQ